MNKNSVDYKTNSIVENFFDGIFPIIRRPTKITTHSSTAIHHILKKHNFIHKFFLWYFQSRYFGPFTNLLLFRWKNYFQQKRYLFKRNPNLAYNRLIRMLSKAYDTSFHKIQKIIQNQIFPKSINNLRYSNIKMKARMVWTFFKEMNICFWSTNIVNIPLKNSGTSHIS